MRGITGHRRLGGSWDRHMGHFGGAQGTGRVGKAVAKQVRQQARGNLHGRDRPSEAAAGTGSRCQTGAESAACGQPDPSSQPGHMHTLPGEGLVWVKGLQASRTF